jgi:hypothetical protein
MMLTNLSIVIDSRNIDNIVYENNDNLFVERGEITAIQIDNYDDLLCRSLARDSIDNHESVDSWLYDDNEMLEDEDDFWMFDVNSNGLWGLG